jgi:hypothetical protein
MNCEKKSTSREEGLLGLSVLKGTFRAETGTVIANLHKKGTWYIKMEKLEAPHLLWFGL